jgi:hypothetical protein
MRKAFTFYNLLLVCLFCMALGVFTVYAYSEGKAVCAKADKCLKGHDSSPEMLWDVISSQLSAVRASTHQ